MAADYFPTIEQSDPFYERDGLRHVTVFSPSLKNRADITLALPPNTGNLANVPIVLLLHGVFGSHWGWTMNGGAHKTMQRMVSGGEIAPIVLAMPSDGLCGQGSGYLPRNGSDFEAWIMRDVPRAVRQTVPCTSASSPLFIAGLSMGGFGAMRIGAKYPDLFRGISGHSSATDIEQIREPFTTGIPDTEGWLGCPEATVLHWMKTHRKTLPPLRFDCGRDDDLIEYNRKLHASLDAANIPHIYEEFEGAHTWEYWKKHLEDTLLFFNKQLNGRK